MLALGVFLFLFSIDESIHMTENIHKKALVKAACVKVENVFSIIGVGLSTALSKKPKEFRLLNVSVRYMEHVCKGGVRFVLRAIPYAAARFHGHCPACRTYLIATRFWVVVICPTIKCLTVLEFSFILFDLCLFITISNFILNYVPIVTFWIFTYHKIWICELSSVLYEIIELFIF